MSEIVKTKGVVLRKLDYGDSSKIVTFYTRDFGKISAIIKGARTAKSKIGLQVDTLNLLQIVIYKKESRSIQILSQADLISHFTFIKEDLDKLKNAAAVLELINKLTPENEANLRLFRGLEKILKLLDNKESDPDLLFTKFFMFFIDEIGYGINFTSCSSCKQNLESSVSVAFNYGSGALCDLCKKEHLFDYELSKELFNLLICLTTVNKQIQYKKSDLNNLNIFLERYLTYHVPEFNGLNSFRMY